MSKECVKDICYICMGYRVNEPDENGVAYDMNTEYIDGNYVFQSDFFLGGEERIDSFKLLYKNLNEG